MKDIKNTIEKIINNFKYNINKIDNLELINSIKIKFKNKIQKLSDIAYTKMDKNNNIIITPIELEGLKIIEENINKLKLDLSILNKGKYIILLKQEMNKEKKIKIIKFIKKEAENNRIIIRNIRRKFLNELKKENNETNKKILNNNIENIVNENILLIEKISLEKIKNL